MIRHTEMAQLAVGWALHALEPDEESTFLDHLPDCLECEALVAETVSTLSELALADEGPEPPPALLTRILEAAVADDPTTDPPFPVPPVPDVLAVPAVRPVPVSHAAPEPPTHLEPPEAPRPPEAPQPPETHQPPETPQPPPARRGLGSHRVGSPRGRTRRTRLVAVAAGVAVLAAVGGLVGVNQALRGERDQQAAAAASAGAAADDAQQVVSVLADAGRPGTVHATLASPAGGYLGLVVARDGVPTVLTTGVGTNRPDQTYVLWGLGQGKAKPVALGVFDVGGSGPSVRSVPSAAQAAPWAGYAVSLEPGRVAPASPTDVVASGQVGT